MTDENNNLLLQQIAQLRKSNRWLRWFVVIVGWLPLATNAMWLHTYHQQQKVRLSATNALEDLNRQAKEYGQLVKTYEERVHDLETATEHVMALCHVRKVSYQ